MPAKNREVRMLPLNRREIIAGTAASRLAPAAASAYECLTPEQRDLAYNNVAAVGADYAKKKAEEWAAVEGVASKKVATPRHRLWSKRTQ